MSTNASRQYVREVQDDCDQWERLAKDAGSLLVQAVRVSILDGKPLMVQIPAQISLPQLVEVLAPVLAARVEAGEKAAAQQAADAVPVAEVLAQVTAEEQNGQAVRSLGGEVPT